MNGINTVRPLRLKTKLALFLKFAQMSAVPDEVSSWEPSGETPAIAIKLEYPDRYNEKSQFRNTHPLLSSSEDALGSLPEPNNWKRPRVAESQPLKAREDDEKRLASRQKQIDYGKNTTGYQNYLGQIAKYRMNLCIYI